MTKRLALLTSLLFFAGCAKTPVSTMRTDNPEVIVSLLFEHDGIKVYRFYDGTRRIYYTDARGVTTWNESAGKNQTRPVTVETVR